jgi:hypothetical protein
MHATRMAKGFSMTTEDKKLLDFGRMVWGMIQQVHAMSDEAYTSRVITFPLDEGRTVRGVVTIFVVTDKVAVAVERGIRESFKVEPPKEGK